MMATSDIEAGEIIVSVPKTFLMCNETLQKQYGSHPLSMHQLLALHLCYLKHDPTSWWKPYIDLLPSHFNTMPIKYPPTLAKHLPVSLQEEVAQQRERLVSDYNDVVQFTKSRPGFKAVGFEEYEWAWLCVNTRCIHMSTMDAKAKGGNIAMAIYLDFLNHSWEAKASIESGFNTKTQCFEIRTLTPYRKGEQVFINYGPHDNLAILREYGFVIPGNIYNFVSLDQEVWSLFSELETIRGMRLKKAALEREGDYSIKKHEVSYRLLTALRLLALEGPDRQAGFDRRLVDWQDVVVGSTDMISLDNERRVLVMLKSICERTVDAARREETEMMASKNHLEKQGIHPFAVRFLRQIWSESKEIAKLTIADVDEKLKQLY
ncbi:hypothetical protein BX666DRAFT_1863664 [Dichotomocladium elegans]|nr:hypothetical protein BX666DRAFT_1863664 [Dichotomocladium elegans]